MTDWFNPSAERPSQHQRLINAIGAEVDSLKIFRGCVGIDSDANAETIKSDLEASIGGAWKIVDKPADPL